MAVPSQYELYRPILEVADASAEGLSRKELRDELTARFHWTDEDLAEMVPSGAQAKIDNRMNWAIYRLKSAELLDYPSQGSIQITPAGKTFLGEHSGVIRGSLLRRMRTEVDADSNESRPVSDDSGEVAPDEQVARSHQQHQEMLADEILDKLKSIAPAGFERLVVALLSKMGYGDGRVTGKSGDQGIDGILDEDTLGLEKVYVQAKRYDNAQVGEPEIRNFSGSLDRQGAIKGVFITTSTFSPMARQAARDISMGSKFIRLIDGRELAELMIRHGVGVVTEITYAVKKLDANYFAEV